MVYNGRFLLWKDLRLQNGFCLWAFCLLQQRRCFQVVRYCRMSRMIPTRFIINEKSKGMRKLALVTAITVVLFSVAADIFAQSTYKDVSILRGRDSPDDCISCDWTTNCVYVCNYNKYPVVVRYEYKLNSRDGEWRKSREFEVMPAEEPGPDLERSDVPYSMRDYQLLECHDGEIKALRITYVHVKKPSVLEQLLELI